MGRRLPPVETDVDYGPAISTFLAHMHQAVEESDRTNHPPSVEWEQAYEECRELVSRLRAADSSDRHILEELQAWAVDRPLPTLDHFRKTEGVGVTVPTTVATVLRRSGVDI